MTQRYTTDSILEMLTTAIAQEACDRTGIPMNPEFNWQRLELLTTTEEIISEMLGNNSQEN